MKSYDSIDPKTKKTLIKRQQRDDFVAKAEKFVLEKEKEYFERKEKVTLTELCRQFQASYEERYKNNGLAKILKDKGIKVRKILEVDYFN